MVFVWFLLLLAWPVAEIVVFAKIGGAIGWVPAILLTIATALAGSWLMRVQGFRALNRFLQGAEAGEVPMGAVLDGMGIFLAGVLLLLPGFLSDVIGLFLFVPQFRRLLIGWAFRQMLTMPPRPRPGGFGGSRGAGPRRPEPRGDGGGLRRSDNVVDAEFETVAPERKPSDPASLTKDSASKRRDDDRP